MRPPRVLIVDDNRDAADLAAMVLNFEGCSAEAVYDGFDALRADRRFRPDLVLIDLELPGIDGYEVAESLGAEVPPPCMIATSGHPEDQVGGRARASGCTGFLLKPLDIEALLAFVRAAPRREP